MGPKLTAFASPEGSVLPWGGPAGDMGPQLTAFAPPEGVVLPWGGPAGEP